MKKLEGRFVASLVLCAFAAACSNVPKPRSTASEAPAEPKLPIGDEYTLVPGPSDDDTLLGRVIISAPQPGQSLSDLAQPNPCGDKLEPAKKVAMTAVYEDAQELAIGAKANATLGLFGFSADVNHATHFLYKLTPAHKVLRADTVEYAACCAEKGGNACGYGYVQALVYGDGEYATGEETSASGGVNVVSVGGTSGNIALKVLHRKKVQGYFAIAVHPRDPSKKSEVGPLGVAKAAGITETSASDQVKAIYEPEKISVVAQGGDWYFADGRGAVGENNFVRRYRAVTGAKDLDDVEASRTKWMVYLGIGLFVGGGAAALYGRSLLLGPDCVYRSYGDCGKGNPEDTAKQFGIVITALGGVVALSGVIVAIMGLTASDGTPYSHSLTEYDARVYAERYNRKLLRKTIVDVQSSQKTSWLKLPKIDGGPLPNGGGHLSLSFTF